MDEMKLLMKWADVVGAAALFVEVAVVEAVLGLVAAVALKVEVEYVEQQKDDQDNKVVDSYSLNYHT